MGYAAPGGIAGANVPRSVSVPIASPQALIEDPAQLEIPSEHVTLKEIHKGTNGKLIIHIQDAHANLSGQKSIAQALDAFMRQYEIPVVLVEGGDRDVTLDEVKEIADQKTWDVLAGKLLYESVITGPEYLNLTSDYPMKLMGIEYLDLYENNLEAYASLVHDRKLILQYLRKIRKSLTRIKNRLYPEELLAFEESKRQREKTGEFVQVYDQLLDMAQRADVSLDPFPEVLKLGSLQLKEQGIDFEQANWEQAKLLEALSQKGASDQVKYYLKGQHRTKRSQIFQHTFLNHIFKLAEANTIQTHTLTALLKYREYLGEFTGLKMDVLSEELEFLEDFVYRQLLPDENAKKVRAIDRYLVLLEKAYSIAMSSHEFRMLKENEPFFNTSSWQSFMNELSEQLGYKEDLITYEPYLEQADARLKRFYTVVNERDQAFLENSSRILEEKNQDIAFMIAGGYHTENLTKLLRNEGYSYVVIAPIIKHETDQTKYEDILLAPLNAEHKKFDNSTSMTKGFVGQYYRLSGGKIGNPDEVVYAHSGIIKTRVPANLLVAALRGARAKSVPNNRKKQRQAPLPNTPGSRDASDEQTLPSPTSSGSGSRYAAYLRAVNGDRIINHSNPIPYDSQGPFVGSEISAPFREPGLYSRLFFLKDQWQQTNRDENMQVVVLGPGNLKSQTQSEQYYSPQMVEIMAVLGESADEYTVIDISDKTIAASAPPRTYEPWNTETSGVLRSLEQSSMYVQVAQAVSSVLNERPEVDEFRYFDPETLKRRKRVPPRFEVREEVLDRLSIEAVRGFFQELEYGEDQVDLIISTTAYNYALDVSTTAEQIQRLSKIIRALKPNGKFLTNIGLINNIIRNVNDNGQLIEQRNMDGGKYDERLEFIQSELGREAKMDVRVKKYGDIFEITKVGDTQLNNRVPSQNTPDVANDLIFPARTFSGSDQTQPDYQSSGDTYPNSEARPSDETGSRLGDQGQVPFPNAPGSRNASKKPMSPYGSSFSNVDYYAWSLGGDVYMLPDSVKRLVFPPSDSQGLLGSVADASHHNRLPHDEDLQSRIMEISNLHLHPDKGSDLTEEDRAELSRRLYSKDAIYLSENLKGDSDLTTILKHEWVERIIKHAQQARDLVSESRYDRGFREGKLSDYNGNNKMILDDTVRVLRELDLENMERIVEISGYKYFDGMELVSQWLFHTDIIDNLLSAEWQSIKDVAQKHRYDNGVSGLALDILLAVVDSVEQRTNDEVEAVLPQILDNVSRFPTGYRIHPQPTDVRIRTRIEVALNMLNDLSVLLTGERFDYERFQITDWNSTLRGIRQRIKYSRTGMFKISKHAVKDMISDVRILDADMKSMLRRLDGDEGMRPEATFLRTIIRQSNRIGSGLISIIFGEGLDKDSALSYLRESREVVDEVLRQPGDIFGYRGRFQNIQSGLQGLVDRLNNYFIVKQREEIVEFVDSMHRQLRPIDDILFEMQTELNLGDRELFDQVRRIRHGITEASFAMSLIGSRDPSDEPASPSRTLSGSRPPLLKSSKHAGELLAAAELISFKDFMEFLGKLRATALNAVYRGLHGTSVIDDLIQEGKVVAKGKYDESYWGPYWKAFMEYATGEHNLLNEIGVVLEYLPKDPDPYGLDNMTSYEVSTKKPVPVAELHRAWLIHEVEYHKYKLIEIVLPNMPSVGARLIPDNVQSQAPFQNTSDAPEELTSPSRTSSGSDQTQPHYDSETGARSRRIDPALGVQLLPDVLLANSNTFFLDYLDILAAQQQGPFGPRELTEGQIPELYAQWLRREGRIPAHIGRAQPQNGLNLILRRTMSRCLALTEHTEVAGLRRIYEWVRENAQLMFAQAHLIYREGQIIIDHDLAEEFIRSDPDSLRFVLQHEVFQRSLDDLSAEEIQEAVAWVQTFISTDEGTDFMNVLMQGYGPMFMTRGFEQNLPEIVTQIILPSEAPDNGLLRLAEDGTISYSDAQHQGFMNAVRSRGQRLLSELSFLHGRHDSSLQQVNHIMQTIDRHFGTRIDQESQAPGSRDPSEEPTSPSRTSPGARSEDNKLRYASPESGDEDPWQAPKSVDEAATEVRENHFGVLADDQIIRAYAEATDLLEYNDPGRYPRIPTLEELLESLPIGIYPPDYLTRLQARIDRFNEVNTPLPFSKRNVTYSHLRKPKEPYDDAFKNFVAAKQGVLSWIEAAKALNLTVEEAKKLNIQKDYLGEEEGDLRILIEDDEIVDRLRKVIRHMDALHGREAVFAGLVNIRDLGQSLGLSEKNINQKTIFWGVKDDELISLLNHNRRLLNSFSNTKYILFSMISRRSFVKLKPLIEALESPKQDGLWTQEELARETGLSIKSVSKGLIYIRNRIGFDMLNYNYRQLNMSFIHDVLTVNQKASLMRLLGAVEELGGIATANEVRDYLAVNHGMDFRLESVSNMFADNTALFDFVNKRRGRQKRPILERLREYHLGDPVSARRQLLLYEYGIDTKNTLLGAAVLRARVHYGQRYMYQTGRSRSAVGGSAYRYHALPRVFEAVFPKSTKKQTKSPASSTIRVFENALKVMIDEGPDRDSAGTGPNNDVVQYFRETVPRALKLTGNISHMKDLDRFKAMLVKAKSKKYPIMPTSYPITDIGIGKKPKKSATDADSVQKAALAGGPHTAREAGTRANDGDPDLPDTWPEGIQDLNDKLVRINIRPKKPGMKPVRLDITNIYGDTLGRAEVYIDGAYTGYVSFGKYNPSDLMQELYGEAPPDKYMEISSFFPYEELKGQERDYEGQGYASSLVSALREIARRFDKEIIRVNPTQQAELVAAEIKMFADDIYVNGHWLAIGDVDGFYDRDIVNGANVYTRGDHSNRVVKFKHVQGEEYQVDEYGMSQGRYKKAETRILVRIDSKGFVTALNADAEAFLFHGASIHRITRFTGFMRARGVPKEDPDFNYTLSITGARLVQSKEGSRALRWSLSILANLGLEYSEAFFWKADEIRRSVPEVPVTFFDHAAAKMSFVVEQIASLAKRHFTAAVVRGLIVKGETRLVESIDGWEDLDGALNVSGDLFQKNLHMALARRAMLRKYGGDLTFVTFNKDLLNDEGFMAKMQAEGIMLIDPGKINKPASFVMTEDNAGSLVGRSALPKGSSLILYEPTSRDVETVQMSPFTQIFITAIEFNRLALQGLDAQDMDPIVSTLIARSTGLERHRVQDVADELINVAEVTRQIIKFAQEIQFPLTPVDFKYLGEMAIRLAEIATNA